MLYTKYESSGPYSLRQEDFWKLHFKTYFWPRDLHMQPIITIWTLYVCLVYRGPLLWKRTSIYQTYIHTYLHTCYIPNMKALGLVLSEEKIFENRILKTYFFTSWPTYLPIRTIWTILVGGHPGAIPIEFGHITISGSRVDVFWSFSYIIQCKIVTPGAGTILTPGA